MATDTQCGSFSELLACDLALHFVWPVCEMNEHVTYI